MTVIKISLRGRLSYPVLFTPKESAFKKGSSFYSADILFPKTDKKQYEMIDQARRQAAQLKFPNRPYESLLKEAERKKSLLIKDGDEKIATANDPDKYKEAYSGQWYITSTNLQQPTLVDQSAYRITEDTGIFYAGCHIIALINIGCYNYENSKRGFTSTLRGLQFIKNDTPWQGKRTADVDEFQPVEEFETVAEDMPW